MKLPRRSGALALGAASIGALTLLAWGLVQDPAEPWQQLTDGSRVRIVGVAYGARQRVVEGQVWQRLLQPLLPERPPMLVTDIAGWDDLRDRTGSMRPSLPSSVPGLLGGWRDQWEWELASLELVVWVRHRGFGSTWISPYFDLEDEHGCRFRGLAQWLHGNQPREGLAAFHFAAFPRRGGTVRLVSRVRRQQTGRPDALMVRSPQFGPLSNWTPGALPQLRSGENLTFTLAGWVSGRANPIARFKVHDRTGPDVNWEPVSLTASDATGNSITTTRDLEVQPDSSRLIFRGLCRAEPAWKLRVLFVPSFPPRPTASQPAVHWSPAPTATPSWTWTTRIPAAVRGTKFVDGARLSRPELDLEVISVAQPGAPSDDPRDKRPIRSPSVLVHMSRMNDPVRLTLVRVTDERGRSAVPMWQESPLQMPWYHYRPRPSHLFQPGSEQRTFVLPPLPGARSLKLEFVAHRAVPVEFTVAPPRE